MKYVAPSAPLTIGGVLDNWIRLFRSSFAACWAFALVAAAAGALVQLMFTPTLPKPGLPPLQAWTQMWSGLRGPGIFLADIALVAISLVVYSTLLTQQTTVVRGEDPLSFGAALTQGLRRVPQIILGWLVLIIIFVAMFIPMGIGAAVLIPLRHSSLVMTLAVILGICLVFVFIYVSLRLQIWMAAMFSENLSGPASLGRSWELVKGNWWRVTGIAFVSGVVIWVISMAIGAAVGIVTGIIGIHGTTPEAVLRGMQIIGAAGQVARLLTMPLLTAVWLAIYQDLKLRREGGDLAARTEALSSTA